MFKKLEDFFEILPQIQIISLSETLQIVLWTLSSYHDVPELLAFLSPEVDGTFNVFLRNSPFKTFNTILLFSENLMRIFALLFTFLCT